MTTLVGCRWTLKSAKPLGGEFKVYMWVPCLRRAPPSTDTEQPYLNSPASVSVLTSSRRSLYHEQIA